MSLHTSVSSTKKPVVVVLVAIETTNTALIKCCVELLKVKRLANHHFHLTAITQDEEILSSMIVLRELNHRLFFHNTDIRSDLSVQNTVESVARMEGRIDVLSKGLFSL